MTDAPDDIFVWAYTGHTRNGQWNVSKILNDAIQYTRTDIHATALARIADLEFARILNQNAMMRKDERIAELEAELYISGEFDRGE